MPIELVCKFSVSKSCCQAHLYSSIIQRLHSKLVSHLTGQNRFQITRYFLTKVKKMDREEVFDDDNLLQEKISIYQQKSIIRSAFQTFKQTLQDLNFGSNHKSLEIEFCLWLDSLIRQFLVFQNQSMSQPDAMEVKSQSPRGSCRPIFF